MYMRFVILLGRRIHTAEPLVPEPNLVQVETAVGKFKRYKFPCTDQISVELKKVGGETLYSEIHRLICSIWNKEELPQQWKESIFVPIHKRVDKTDCNNYRGISLLSTAYKILSNILLARLTPYVNEIVSDHQCGFRRNINYQSDFLHSADTRESGSIMGRCISSL
jgi:hypothetical protein